MDICDSVSVVTDFRNCLPVIDEETKVILSNSTKLELDLQIPDKPSSATTNEPTITKSNHDTTKAELEEINPNAKNITSTIVPETKPETSKVDTQFENDDDASFKNDRKSPFSSWYGDIVPDRIMSTLSGKKPERKFSKKEAEEWRRQAAIRGAVTLMEHTLKIQVALTGEDPKMDNITNGVLKELQDMEKITLNRNTLLFGYPAVEVLRRVSNYKGNKTVRKAAQKMYLKCQTQFHCEGKNSFESVYSKAVESFLKRESDLNKSDSEFEGEE